MDKRPKPRQIGRVRSPGESSPRTELGLRPLAPWPFARDGAEKLVTAQTPRDFAEYLADALGEVLGRPRLLVWMIVKEFGIDFARERYATTVAVEAMGGMRRADGRQRTPGAVFFHLAVEALGTRWEDLFQAPDEVSKREAAAAALNRVVPLEWHAAGAQPTPQASLASMAPPPRPSSSKTSRSPTPKPAPMPSQLRTADENVHAQRPPLTIAARIVALLEEEPHRSLRAGELAEKLGVSRKTAAPIASLLKARGEIDRTEDGYRALRVSRALTALGDGLEITNPQGLLEAAGCAELRARRTRRRRL